MVRSSTFSLSATFNMPEMMNHGSSRVAERMYRAGTSTHVYEGRFLSESACPWKKKSAGERVYISG